MYVNKYSSSCSALCLGASLYDYVSQPSNLSIVFLAEVSYILGCKPQYSGCVNHWVVSFISPLLMNYIIWYTPSELLIELGTPMCSRWAYFGVLYAFVDYKDLL